MTVDPNIQQKADYIRTKKKGSEVRESLASGLEAMSSDVVENKNRQNEVETQFQQVIENTTDKDVISAPEIIAARNGEPNLKTRLDKDNQQVTEQLAENANNINTKEINAKYPPAPMVGIKADGVTDDTDALKNLIASLDNNGVLRVPDGTILFTEFPFKDRTTLKGSGIDNTTFKYIGVQGGKGLAVPDTSGRQYYMECNGFSIDCDNLANIGLDLSNVSYSNFSNILILNPRITGVLFDSSQRGVYWGTPTVYNVLTNVFVYVNKKVTSFEKGFAFTGGANSHRLINCRATSESKTGVGFSIDDERDNNNVFIGSNAEGINTAFYINGEFNTILSPRIEGATIGVEFGPDEKAKNNTVINPTFYTFNTKYVNVDQNKNNTIIDPSEGGHRLFNKLMVRPQTGHSLIESWTGRPESLALRNMGSARPSFQESVDDDTYRLRSIKDGNFRTVLSVSNTNTPFINADNGIKTIARPTVNRPVLTQLGGLAAGYMMFDTTLNKPIWYDGGKWLDATGGQV